MTLDDLNEAVAVLGGIAAPLKAAVPSQTGRPGAEFRYAVGDMLASAPTAIPNATIGTALRSCFDLAVAAGATLAGLEPVRLASLAVTPAGQTGMWVAGGCYFFCLNAEAQILAATTFTSSDAVKTALAKIQRAFDRGEEWTADNGLPALYQAEITLAAAVSRDLTTRAVSLPRLTSYAFPRGTTSHALAYRLYGDASRCDELRAENGVSHPAFMPASGTALSD